MAHIKEPKGVDFIINSEPLTEEEKAAISAFIRTYRASYSNRPTTKKSVRKRKKNLV